MLQSTRMCSCCIGRFHQLYGFLMFKTSLERNQTVECESPDLQCKFCYQVFMDYELMASEVNKELPKVVSKTLFNNVSPLNVQIPITNFLPSGFSIRSTFQMLLCLLQLPLPMVRVQSYLARVPLEVLLNTLQRRSLVPTKQHTECS